RLVVLHPPPRLTLFPYTTLFRSPPEEQVVVELLHEEPLAAHAVEHLQEQGPQQVLGRDRRPPDLGIQLVELGRQFAQDRVAHGPDRKSTRLNSSHGSISYAVFCL